MAAVRAAAKKVDWTTVTAKLKPETVASLNAFRRRQQELQKTVQELKDQQTSIDFDAYRRVLSNKGIVDEAQKAFAAFKPASYDVTEQVRIIEQHEANAVAAAEKTTQKIQVELKELDALLKNIETARPLDQLTVDDIASAIPELDPTVEKMVKRGQWKVPGYYERFGEYKVGF
ncbi:hypothetical protein BJ742DRAFT_853153 [Cladochytrium replicatum]|nr:hypothetical protein BJ742DRAFT_853153 [Cladochytrium replicatum]